VDRLSKTIEERDKISDAHQTTISELKRKYGKQLDKTLKDENDNQCTNTD
jgi:molybdopterin converting factor small subunit